MEQIIHILLTGIKILYPVLLGCGMIFLYKRRTPAMNRFYYLMSVKRNAPRLYIIFFFAMLLAYNYCCYATSGHAIGVLMATILFAPFAIFRLINPVLRGLTEYADLLFAVLIIVLAAGLVTEAHVAVVTLLTYLVASMFYPSQEVIDKEKELPDTATYDERLSLAIHFYYAKPKLKGSILMKHLAHNNKTNEESNDKENIE